MQPPLAAVDSSDSVDEVFADLRGQNQAVVVVRDGKPERGADPLRPARVPGPPALTRIALISDAHGNAVGLRAALDDLAGRGVDEVVSLGDVAQGGPQPVECLGLVREAGAQAVMGNSDAFLLDPDLSSERTTDRHIAQREWSLGRLSEQHLSYMRSFEPTVDVDLDGARLLCFHGTPASYDEIVLPGDPTDPFDGTGADMLAGGHVHIQQLRRVGEACLRQPRQRRLRLRAASSPRGLQPRPVGVVRDRRAGVRRVPPRAVRSRGADGDHRGERITVPRTHVESLQTVKLYNSQLSGNCWKARQILALRGIEYERDRGRRVRPVEPPRDPRRQEPGAARADTRARRRRVPRRVERDPLVPGRRLRVRP